MLLYGQPSSSRSRDADDAPDSPSALECDRCGEAVPRQLVAGRPDRRAAGDEAIVVCAGCDGGAD